MDPSSPSSPGAPRRRGLGFNISTNLSTLLPRRAPRQRFRNRFHYASALRSADGSSPSARQGGQQAWVDLWEAIASGAQSDEDAPKPEDAAAQEACERWRRKVNGQRNDVWTRLSSSFGPSHRDRDRLTFAIRSGVPASLRASVWYACSGAARKRREAGKSYAELVELGLQLTNEAANVIEVDLPRTGVSEEQMTPLRNILRAFAAKNPEIGYCQSMNFIAKTLLLYCKEEPAFWIFSSLLEDILPKDYYTQLMSGLRSDLKLLDSLVERYLPLLRGHLVQRGIDLSPITMNWFLCLFVNTLPAEGSHRVLDCLLHEGPKVLFRAALGILHIKEQELLKTEAVVDAYVILRAPFGSGSGPGADLESPGPQTNLLASMYGPWLRGLSTNSVAAFREEHRSAVLAEDAVHAAKKEAWRKQEAEKKARAAEAAAEVKAQEKLASSAEAEQSTITPESTTFPPEAEPHTPEPETVDQRAKSFAIIEQLPAPAQGMGHEERAKESPKAAASWLARLTQSEVVEESPDERMGGEEGGVPMLNADEHLMMDASPRRSMNNFLFCCRWE